MNEPTMHNLYVLQVKLKASSAKTLTEGIEPEGEMIKALREVFI